MGVWRFVDAIRELRLLWPASDCSGVSISTTLLLILLAWLAGIFIGVLVTTCCLSPSFRKVLVIGLQALLAFLGPVAPVIPSRAEAVRGRLQAYRGRE